MKIRRSETIIEDKDYLRYTFIPDLEGEMAAIDQVVLTLIDAMLINPGTPNSRTNKITQLIFKTYGQVLNPFGKYGGAFLRGGSAMASGPEELLHWRHYNLLFGEVLEE